MRRRTPRSEARRRRRREGGGEDVEDEADGFEKIAMGVGAAE